jgi:hypothetical protein
MDGQSRIAHTFISPDEAQYRGVEADIVRYQYAPARAEQAITGLGYGRGSDGVFVDAAGGRLSVPISATVQNDRNVKTTVAVASDWRRMGVAVEEILIPIQRAQDREYRAQFPGFEIAAALGGVTATLVDRYLVTIPSSERIRLLASIVRHQTENLTMLPLFYEATPTMASHRLTNIIPRGERFTEAWNAEQWDLTR